MHRGPPSWGLFVGLGPLALNSKILLTKSSRDIHFVLKTGLIIPKIRMARNIRANGYMPAAITGIPATHGTTKKAYGTWKNGMKNIDMKIFRHIIPPSELVE